MSAAGTLEAAPAGCIESLQEQLNALRHDLGKYLVFQLRWLPPEPTDDELREALEADLARTRTSGDLVESGPALWARLRPVLVGERSLLDGSRVDLGQDPDLLVIDRCMLEIQRLLPVLRSAPRTALEGGQRAALEVSSATRRLQKRARSL